MPKFNVITWSAYNITKFLFYTKSMDDSSTMQNSRVMVELESMYFSSSNNNNLVLVSKSYFRVIEEILKINYVTFKVPFLSASGMIVTLV